MSAVSYVATKHLGAASWLVQRVDGAGDAVYSTGANHTGANTCSCPGAATLLGELCKHQRMAATHTAPPPNTKIRKPEGLRIAQEFLAEFLGTPGVSRAVTACPVTVETRSDHTVRKIVLSATPNSQAPRAYSRRVRLLYKSIPFEVIIY